MTLPTISAVDSMKIAFGVGLIILSSYCMWKGRRVKTIKWQDDNNNPANWYLKDPNKYKIK